ncbi:ABC transporter substrate-binding protein [bacterium]|nr:ABC transporter substrate-binding protein [bacterium]
MYALGKRVDAIDAWQRAWADGTASDQAFLRSRIQETGDQLTVAERDELADTLTQPDVRTILGLGAPNELGAPPMPPPLAAAPTAAQQRQAAAESEADTAAGYQALEAAPLPLGDQAAGDALAAGAQVACLLPLTGPDRASGQQALNGLRRAFAGDASTLLVRDTGGDPDLAARLADALAADVNVLAIIGPTQDRTAAAVAPIAERAQLPTVLLTNASGLTGAYVLRSGIASSQGAQGLAYDTGVMVRDAIADGARSRGALLAALRQQTRRGDNAGAGSLANGDR